MPRRKPIRYDPANDLYVVLGVLPTASMDDVRRSFRLRAKEVHPDHNPDNSEWAHRQFQRLNEAYDVLNDPELRTEYDTKRRVFTKERGPDGTAWWERPHPASGPRTTETGARTSAFSGSTTFDGTWMPPRTATPLRRKKKPQPPYQTLFVISFLVLVGSICASMTRVRVTAPNTPDTVAAALPTQVVAPDSGLMCLSPDATITDPPYGSEVSHRFSIKGTAAGSHFVSYSVDFQNYDIPVASDWLPLLPGEQYRPVKNGVLVPESATASLPRGNYLIRLVVNQNDGTRLSCWWPLFKTQ